MSRVSVDTVRVGFCIDRSLLSLQDWVHNEQTRTTKNNGVIYKEDYTKKVTTFNEAKIFMIFRPRDLYDSSRNNYLYLEFSWPKILYGCNHTIISDWDLALNTVDHALASIPGLPPLPGIRDAFLYRVDVCANFQVGKNWHDYIRILQQAHYPRRRTCPYKNEKNLATGVVFRPKKGAVSTCFYAKQQECLHKEAEGVLRLEISFRRKSTIAKKFGIKNLTLKDISPEMLLLLVQKELQILKLDNDIVCDRREVEKRLSQKYSARRVRSLMGYLLQTGVKTRDQMILDGTSRKSICNYEKLLKQAGISSLSLDKKMILPALPLSD